MGNTNSMHNIESDIGGLTWDMNRNIPKHKNALRLRNEKDAATHAYPEHEEVLLRRHQSRPSTNVRCAKSLPHPNALPGSVNVAQFKVLPQVNDRLKLRSTTNGAILQAGGTISGRKESKVEMLEPKGTNHAKLPFEMKRSRTCIDSFLEKQPHEAVPVERRSVRMGRAKTSLHLKPMSNEENNNRLDGRLNARYESNDRKKISSKTTALNKYNKKRKAPSVPNVHPSVSAEGGSSGNSTIHKNNNNNNNNSNNKNNCNSNKNDNKQIGEKRCNSPNMQSTRLSSPAATSAQAPSAKMQQRQHQHQQQQQKHAYDDRGRAVAEAQQEKVEKGPRTAAGKSHAFNSHLTSDEPNKKVENVEAERSLPKKASNSKIPKLKRTFYFGMRNSDMMPGPATDESGGNEAIESIHQSTPDRNVATKKVLAENDTRIDMHATYTILDNQIETIIDNKLTIHIRPTLPRKQSEPPRFSPLAAWRTLLETEFPSNWRASKTIELMNSKRKSLQIEATNDSKPHHTNSAETPLKLVLQNSIAELNQQQQPLNNATTKLQMRNEHFHSGSHSSSSSLSSFKSGTDTSDDICNYLGSQLMLPSNEAQEGEEEEPLPTKNIAAFHLFGLTLPRNAMGVRSEKTESFKSLQKLKSADETDCDCFKGISKVASAKELPDLSSSIFAKIDFETQVELQNHRSDNWVLHRTYNTEPPPWKSSLTCSMDPISLTYLTGGRHVMYLPDAASKTKSNPKFFASQSNCGGNFKKSLNPSSPSRHSTVMDNQNDTKERREHLKNPKSIAEKCFEHSSKIFQAEMEAISRVEEDFQRKRAAEKHNLRHQLQAYFSNEHLEKKNIAHRYIRKKKDVQAISAFHFNEKFTDLSCRADPDGAISTPSPISSNGDEFNA